MSIERFKDERACIEEAWRRIQLEVFMDRKQFEEIKKAYFADNLHNVHCYEAARILNPLFAQKEWSWNNLDQHIHLFREEYGTMPYMLHWASPEFDVPDPYELKDKVLEWFTVAELKQYCSERGLTKQGKRADIEARIVEDGNFFSDWLPVIMKRHEEKVLAKEESDHKNRVIIFLHYIVMTFFVLCKLPGFKKHQDWRPYGRWTSSGDSVEEWYSSRFRALTEDCYPPFFPGDRTGILSLMEKEAEEALLKKRKIFKLNL